MTGTSTRQAGAQRAAEVEGSRRAARNGPARGTVNALVNRLQVKRVTSRK